MAKRSGLKRFGNLYISQLATFNISKRESVNISLIFSSPAFEIGENKGPFLHFKLK